MKILCRSSATAAERRTQKQHKIHFTNNEPSHKCSEPLKNVNETIKYDIKRTIETIITMKYLFLISFAKYRAK
jgi:hypothetical protein